MITKKLFQTSFTIFKININYFSNKKDLYQILGVGKKSTSNQIKKAYYKLAQQHHPDKNSSVGAKDKFLEINNAYQVLSDEQKRKNYDSTGSSSQNPFGFNQDTYKNYYSSNDFGFNNKSKAYQSNEEFQSMFQDLFGGKHGQKFKKRSNQPPKEDLHVKLQIQFKQSVTGTKKHIQYNRTTNCNTCKGTKSTPGAKAQKCALCQGTGFMTMRQGILLIRVQCNSCDGQGIKITSRCKSCSGIGNISAESQQQIIIPRGIHDGASLKFRGKGNMNGDLVIKINVKKHPMFKRQGIDCLIQKQISIPNAALGCQIQYNNLNDEKKKTTIPKGTQIGQKIKIPRQGFYKLNSTQKGNMIITINVKVPQNPSKLQKQLYQQLKKLQQQKSK